MDVLKIFKIIVFALSFAMFCYQLRIATISLINPPMVDSTYERDITDDEIPLITMCPSKQIDYKRLKEFEYNEYEYLLDGQNQWDFSSYMISWGAHLNQTFQNVLRYVMDLDRDFDGAFLTESEKDELVYIPKYGFCKEMDKFTSTLLFSLDRIESYRNGDARILITNKNYRSFFMPDISSHVGSKVLMKHFTSHDIDVKIQVKYSCLNDEEPMKSDEFEKCVDDKIQTEFAKYKVECVPPWLSRNNQCNKTYSKSFDEFYGNLDTDFMRKILQLRNTRFEEDCRQSCKETMYIVSEYEESASEISVATISVGQKVVVTEKVPNYSMFQYIIDVGSSLGLWLGLSVFGLHDLVVDAVQFIRNSFLIKKFTSVMSK